MEKNKIIKETLNDIILNLKTQREYIQHMINDVEIRIKSNKEAGNIVTIENVSPAEKEEIQRVVKEQLEVNSEEFSQHPQTTAKKLMPKMREKV